MLEALLTSFVWITANVTYRSCVRDGERGFKRFAALCLGWPGTLVSFFSVRRGMRFPGMRLPKSEMDESEAERSLLMEIRRDRSLRITRKHGEDRGGPQGEGPQGDGPQGDPPQGEGPVTPEADLPP